MANHERKAFNYLKQYVRLERMLNNFMEDYIHVDDAPTNDWNLFSNLLKLGYGGVIGFLDGYNGTQNLWALLVPPAISFVKTWDQVEDLENASNQFGDKNGLEHLYQSKFVTSNLNGDQNHENIFHLDYKKMKKEMPALKTLNTSLAVSGSYMLGYTLGTIFRQ